MGDTVSIADQVACAKRELRMRESAYPRWIAAGRMTEKKAALEIAGMTAIVASLERLADSERLI